MAGEEDRTAEATETKTYESDDAALKRIMGVEVEEPTAPESGEEQPTETPEEPEAESVEDEPAPDEPTGDDEHAAPDEESDDFRSAMAALIRDGVPRKTLDEMAKGDLEGFLKWGAKRAKVQRDYDEASRELGELRKTKETASKEPESGSQTPEQPALDLDSAVEPFAELLGADAVEPMKAFGRAIADHYSQKLEGQQQMLQFLATLTSRSVERQAVADLRDDYPQLSKSEDAKAVTEKAWSLLTKGEAATFEDAMADACRIRFADALRAGARDDLVRERKQRAKGAPQNLNGRNAQPKTKTAEEREIAAAMAAASGKSRDEINEIYNS